MREVLPEAMSAAVRQYRFEGIEVDVAACLVLRDGVRQPLEPKAFAVLLHLLRHHGEVVARDELLDAVWGHRHVTPGVLTRVIAQLRHALADDALHPRMIETRHALGYRFIAPLIPEQAIPEQLTQEQGAREQAVPEQATLAPAESGEPAAASDHAPAEATTSAMPEGQHSPAKVGPVVATLESTAAADRERSTDHAIEPLAVEHHRRRGDVPVTSGALAMAGQDARGGAAPARARVVGRWLLIAAGGCALAAAVWWFGLHRPGAEASTAGATAIASAHSVAVLPFDSISGDADDRNFTDGLSQEMHGALAEVPGLEVAAWQSHPLPSGSGDVREIGKRLGVASVLDGSVQREGKRLRVQARLSDTRTGYVLWSRSYDRDIGDLFDTQTEIATAVVKSLLGQLPGDSSALRRRLEPTRNVEAYQDYLRGIALLGDAGEGGSSRAIGAFNAALSQDATFARAQAYLCRIQLRRFQNARDADAFRAAEQACARARKLGPELGEVRVALGDLYRLHGQPQQARVEYQAALASPEGHDMATLGLAILDLQAGRTTAAQQGIAQVLRRRPDDALMRAEIGYQYYLAGDLARATAMYADAVRLAPDDAGYWDTYGGLLLAAGDLAMAKQALHRAAVIAPTYVTFTNLGEIAYRTGHYAEAADFARQAIALDARDALVWSNLGDALSAIGATSSEVRKAYTGCARLLSAYVAGSKADPASLAQLAWCRANLGEAAAASGLVERAIRQPDPTGEAAFAAAATWAQLGDLAKARTALQAARAAGVPESRIRSYLVFSRAGLVPPPTLAGSQPRPVSGGTTK